MEAKWNQLVEDLAEGRLPFVEAMMSASKAMVQPGDYRAYINHHRSFTMLMSDPRILRRMHQELMAKLDELTEGKFDKRAEERAIRAKDGFRLFSKLADVHDQVYGESPSLLCGATFEECLEQYHRLMGHMETLWDDACRLYREGHFPLSTFLAILTIEEIGKLGRLWHDLMGWDIPDKVPRKDLGRLGRDHHKKHFMGVMAGAIVNSRLDRIVGAKRIKQLLQDVESGELERLRQACLYIDMREEKVVLPEDLVYGETAQFYAVVAGELWAEVLGHVPWEFERMNKKVTDFEIEVGMPEELVKRF